MQQLGDTHSVERCDICGDVGFPEVIATCSKCKVAREHVYCMQNYIKIIPEEWICESCHSGNDTISPTRGGNKNSSGDFGLNVSDITNHDYTHTTSPYNVPQHSGWLACSRSQKVVGTGKVKFIPEEEVVRLSCGKFSTKPFPANSSMHKAWKTCGQSKNVIAKIPTPTVKYNPSLLSMGPEKLPRHGGVQKNSMNDKQAPCSLSKGRSKEYDLREHSSSSIRLINKEETSRASAQKANVKASCTTAASSLPVGTAVTVETLDVQDGKQTKKASCVALQAGQSSSIVGSGDTFCASGEYKKSNVEESDLWNIQTNFKLYRCYLPSSHATWRGGFKFLQTAACCEFYDGLEAQPSCTVQRKAYNFSRIMPSVLEVEPLPMSSVLTDLFRNDCPNLQDVALYFFPSDNSERSRQNLNHVCEFLDAKNSMLRSFVDGVELLVFTSKQLDVGSQGTIARVNAKYLLWGLFRSVKNDKAIESLPDIEVVDMDIDMVGGKDVLGRIDHVPKDKPRNFSISSEEMALLHNTSGKVDKTSSSPKLRKKIKTEFSSDLSLWNSVKEYHNIMDRVDVPPGFEGVHVGVSGHSNFQPPKFKKICDLY